jgi:uncharacterized membrane protein YebE (DUF533 family)
MGAGNLLDQLLRSGLSGLQPGGRGGVSSDWGRFGAGAATGGVLGLLLGSKRGRSYGGKALKYGSVAALGALAYHAWQQYQANQATAAPGGTPAAPVPVPQTIDRLPPPQAEPHARAMLQAMVAAAKADGHLDDRERELVQAELRRQGSDAELQAWFERELRQPLDPAEVARAATSPEVASEMYLASLLVADETNFMERAYLDEFARQLKLPEGLKVELERQAAQA